MPLEMGLLKEDLNLANLGKKKQKFTNFLMKRVAFCRCVIWICKRFRMARSISLTLISAF